MTGAFFCLLFIKLSTYYDPFIYKIYPWFDGDALAVRKPDGAIS